MTYGSSHSWTDLSSVHDYRAKKTLDFIQSNALILPNDLLGRMPQSSQDSRALALVCQVGIFHCFELCILPFGLKHTVSVF